MLSAKFHKNHYLYLMVVLLAQLLVRPFFENADGQGILISILSSLTVFAAIFAANVKREQLFIALGLAGFSFAGIWYVIFVEAHYYLAMSSVVVQLAFNFYVVALILTGLFRAKQVTSNTIYGAVSVYLLIGFSFAMLYIFLESFWLGSFYVDAAHNPNGNLQYLGFIYFSFSTLTTLGYGDITPVSAHARSATSLQAILGVLYVAILISRFVGVYIAQASKTE